MCPGLQLELVLQGIYDKSRQELRESLAGKLRKQSCQSMLSCRQDKAHMHSAWNLAPFLPSNFRKVYQQLHESLTGI